MPQSELNDFLENTIAKYNHSLNLSSQEIQKTKDQSKNDGFLGGESSRKKPTDSDDLVIVFFNPKMGIEIGLNYVSAFPLDFNPYFDEKNSDRDLIYVFSSSGVSKELAEYCFEIGKGKLPFFTHRLGSFLQKDLDFLLRFWKNDSYFSKPAISFTGQDT
jgi:hypothetical protein